MLPFRIENQLGELALLPGRPVDRREPNVMERCAETVEVVDEAMRRNVKNAVNPHCVVCDARPEHVEERGVLGDIGLDVLFEIRGYDADHSPWLEYTKTFSTYPP